jgi:transcriptional regulator with GAF, ATPase, and Fis domain
MTIGWRLRRLTVLITGETEREAIESALHASCDRVAGTNGTAKRLRIPASTLDFRTQRLGWRIDKFGYRGNTANK